MYPIILHVICENESERNNIETFLVENNMKVSFIKQRTIGQSKNSFIKETYEGKEPNEVLVALSALLENKKITITINEK